MKYLSVCSGIESASVAWKALGWEPLAFSEIEAFPSAVLAHHYPNVPNLGDMATIPARLISGTLEAPDILVGGTPCQSFSLAGLRKSLDDSRGNLSLIFCEIANEIDSKRTREGKSPAIIVWENVPGVLSTKDNAFGCFLAGLAGEDEPLIAPGGKWENAGCVFGSQRAIAWRVLDAQYFGVAQRRRRVFVVASARDGFDPTAVLFEFEGTRRDSPPSNSQETSASSSSHDSRCCESFGTWWDGRGVSQTLDAVLYKKQAMPEKNRFPAVMIPAWEKCSSCEDYICNIHGGHAHDCECPVIDAWAEEGISPYDPCLLRFITPTEGERLMGFPDSYTQVPYKGKTSSDTPRYKAIGNSMVVPCMSWIGKRIKSQIK